MRVLLIGAGYGVACAAHGREALDFLRRGKLPTVILLDLSMPVRDGWHFRQEQRRDPTLAPIPVVLLSAEHDLSGLAAALGAAGYCPKPVEAEWLLRAVRLISDSPATSST